MCSLRLFTIALLVVYTSACTKLVLNLSEEIDEYFVNQYSHRQFIRLDKVFDYRTCESYNLLESGNVTNIQLEGNQTVVVCSQMQRSNKLYYFSEVANGTTSYVIWSNETHHTQGVDLIGTVFRQIWESPFCYQSLGKASCTYINSTAVRLTLLPAAKAVQTDTMLRLHLQPIPTCPFKLPPVRMRPSDCPPNSSFCKPKCSVKANVENANIEVVDDTGVVLTWYPPNDKEDVAAYAIRWGILDDLEEGSASFPIDCSTGFFWVLPNSSAEKQEYSFHVDIEEFSHKYIAAQVVAFSV
ncbi:hypothetical protein EB796_016934 [Bugula neritina]|uniref:Fibronectin type-III domain-containing protein n=1 Tax=Bugula neritina TaxID=10212 RepID=A0A7J7JEV5_BUGNE|nr:hypothetical protein EB796_016934 [Bugula neritina]